MTVPSKPVKCGLLAVLLLIGSSVSGVSAKSRRPGFKPVALATSSIHHPPASADLLSTTHDSLAKSVVEKTIPRGGEGEVGLAQRLKIAGYFALWYILNIVYNSEYYHFCIPMGVLFDY